MRKDGTNIDLLQLYGVRTQLGRYVALVMDHVFTNEELCTITASQLIQDERYNIIKGKMIIKLISFIILIFLFQKP